MGKTGNKRLTWIRSGRRKNGRKDLVAGVDGWEKERYRSMHFLRRAADLEILHMCGKTNACMGWGEPVLPPSSRRP